MKYYSEKFRKREEWRKKFSIPANYSITRAVLDILLDGIENQTLFESPYQHIKRLSRQINGLPAPARWRYNRAIRYLQQRGQVKLVRKNDQMFIELTKKGKLEVLLDRIRSEARMSQKWDGKWRIVVWDIPESSAKARDRVRYFLKNLGFHRLQMSVFIRPFPISSRAVEYLVESGLMKFIRFLRVDKIDDEGALLKQFKIRKIKSRNI